VSSDEKAEVAKWAGAQHVIVTSRQTVVDEVLRLTNGEGCEGIFDGTGKDTFDDNFKIAKRKGTIVSLGNASGPVPPFPIFKLADRNLKVLRPRYVAW
jgi:NADPH2:quinone reductase